MRLRSTKTLNRTRLTAAENQNRYDSIILQAKQERGDGYYRYVGDSLILAFLAGELDEIYGTSWVRWHGECLGERVE